MSEMGQSRRFTVGRPLPLYPVIRQSQSRSGIHKSVSNRTHAPRCRTEAIAVITMPMSNRAAPSATATSQSKYLRRHKPLVETLSKTDNDIREPREPARQKKMGAKQCLETEHCYAPPSACWQQRCLQLTHSQWSATERTGRSVC